MCEREREREWQRIVETSLRSFPPNGTLFLFESLAELARSYYYHHYTLFLSSSAFSLPALFFTIVNNSIKKYRIKGGVRSLAQAFFRRGFRCRRREVAFFHRSFWLETRSIV